ncbi:hypothetical protein Naga_100893g2 [Nannochloropsis gaditana]|uniref:Uncharacterized protein n=2 Tax=Nannochloropsis gaditana TaxID=72520 RepID=W7TQB5_9STRA|nr:hypothetical protein Naga_100893g2 [Nannochloropsis gaditana]
MRRQRRQGCSMAFVCILLVISLIGGSEAFIVPGSRIRPIPSIPSFSSPASSSSRRSFQPPTTALSSPSRRFPSFASRRLGGRSLTMLKEPQGSDAFARVVEKEGKLSPLAKLHSGPAQILKVTTVPLAAVGGFLATPKGAGGMFRVFGGLVGGLVLKEVNSKLRTMRQAGAEVAVARLLLDYESDIASLTPSAVKAVTAKYDVNYAEHLEIMRTLYTSFLVAMLQWPQVRMQEPASLMDLSAALGLDSSTIGDAHCAAAEEVARMLAEVPLEEREEAWEQGMVGKLLFLSDRLYAQLEEEETREYELGRVTEVLGLTPKEGEERVRSLVLPYYTNIVQNGVTALRTGEAQGGPRDGPTLLEWRQSLGVSETQANGLHAQVFAEEVTRCLEAGQGRIRDGDMERLSSLRKFLGITSLDAERVLEGVTAPMLRQAIVEMLTRLTSTPSDTWPEVLGHVRQRQKELHMVDSALVFHIKDVYRERLKGLVQQANDAALPLETAATAAALGEAGGPPGLAETASKLCKSVGAAMLLMRLMREFLEVNKLEDVMDEDLFHLSFLGLLPGEMTQREREITFRQYVAAVVEAKLVDDEGGNINALGVFLEMDPAYVRYTLKSLVGPIYEEKVREFVVEKEAMTEANQAVLLQLVRDFHVEEADMQRIGLKYYGEKARGFWEKKQEFSEGELGELASLKSFLLLSDRDVDQIHEPLARDAFLQAVQADFARQKKAAEADLTAAPSAPPPPRRVSRPWPGVWVSPRTPATTYWARP